MTDLVHDALNLMLGEAYVRINSMASKLEQNIDRPCPVCHGDSFLEASNGSTHSCGFCAGRGRIMSKSGEV